MTTAEGTAAAEGNTGEGTIVTITAEGMIVIAAEEMAVMTAEETTVTTTAEVGLTGVGREGTTVEQLQHMMGATG